MHILHQLVLMLVSVTQPPEMGVHEFLRNIDPPRTGQHLEIRLKDNSEHPIQGILRNRTNNNCYELETDEDTIQIIRILDIDTVTHL